MHLLALAGLAITSNAFAASPAFSVHKNGTDQTVAGSTHTMLTWSTEVFEYQQQFLIEPLHADGGRKISDRGLGALRTTRIVHAVYL